MVVAVVRTEKADVVHSFTIKCAVYGGLAARLAGTARVNAVAGMAYVFISDEALARTLRPIVWALLRLASARVSSSRMSMIFLSLRKPASAWPRISD
jgi:hypothetical protein